MLIVGLISGCEPSIENNGVLMERAPLSLTYEDATKYVDTMIHNFDSLKIPSLIAPMIEHGEVTFTQYEYRVKILEKKDQNTCYVEIIIPQGNKKVYTACYFIRLDTKEENK
jgi:hypothetical protein